MFNNTTGKYFMSLKNPITLYNSEGKIVRGDLLICDDALTEHCVVYTIVNGKIGFLRDKTVEYTEVGRFNMACDNVLSKQIINQI
jgi:hypothetical protein